MQDARVPAGLPVLSFILKGIVPQADSWLLAQTQKASSYPPRRHFPAAEAELCFLFKRDTLSIISPSSSSFELPSAFLCQHSNCNEHAFVAGPCVHTGTFLPKQLPDLVCHLLSTSSINRDFPAVPDVFCQNTQQEAEAAVLF